MCDSCISVSLNFFIKVVLGVSESFDARITFIIWSILSKANIKIESINNLGDAAKKAVELAK